VLVIVVALQFATAALYSLVIVGICFVLASAVCALLLVPYIRFFRDELWIRSVRASQVVRGEDVASVFIERSGRSVYPVLRLRSGAAIALSTYFSPDSKYSAAPQSTLAGRVIEQTNELVARAAAQRESDASDRSA
jgi:hypothetical protein